MKLLKFFCLTALAVYGLCCQAQTETIINIGQNAEGKEIVLPGVQFDREIDALHMIPYTNYALFVTHAETKGGSTKLMSEKFGVYDLEKKKILWTKKLGGKGVRTCPYGVLIYLHNQTQMLDAETGKALWHTEGEPQFSLYGDSIFLMTDINKKMSAINVFDGAKLWMLPTPNSIYSFEKVGTMSPSRQLLMSDNILYSINFEDASLQTLKVIPYMADGRTNALSALLSLSSAVVTGYASGGSYATTSVNGPSRIYGLHSNLAQQDSNYFYADHRDIYCLDSLLNIRWKTQLGSGKIGTASRLTVVKDKVYMFNQGYGDKPNGNRVLRELPFIASFNISDGTMSSMRLLCKNKKKYNSVLGLRDGFIGLSNDTMFYYPYADSSKVISKNWSTLGKKAEGSFLTDTMYVDNGDNTFSPITSTDTTAIIFSEGSLAVVNQDLDIVKIYDARNCFFKYREGNHYCVLSNYAYLLLTAKQEDAPTLTAKISIPNTKRINCAPNSMLLVQGDNAAVYIDDVDKLLSL